MTAYDTAYVFIELGAAIAGLALLARLASRLGISAIPLYLLAGLALGNGGIAPLDVSRDFIHTGAEIGVVLLLFLLGLEYTGEELRQNLRSALPAGVVDLALNFPPGLLAGFLLGWSPLAAVLMGGITWVSSSAVAARVLVELKRLNNPETPSILSVLVLEDFAMAAYLPIVAALVAGGSPGRMAASVVIAVITVSAVLLVAIRYGRRISALASHESAEILLLTTFGAVLFVAGVAQRLQVSAAIGAFLVGISLSGPVAERSHHLLAPLRDLFAAIFFFFFGLRIDPASLPPLLPSALALAIVTTVTKILTGRWAAKRAEVAGGLRAGMALVARGEFSMVIAGMGASTEPRLEVFSATYVLLMAVLGPVLARLVK